MTSNKIYVDVIAEFTKDGRLLPISLKWDDGRTFEIQRVTDIRRAASLKAGGVGTRYTCIICAQEKYLYYEGNSLWFMERAGA
ncbi:hypothetical protein [Anaerobium acetethylicum]|uniref:Uncharacterized protein n=1 Tax=Anaerobium acetethylicum TaxID=1619234 RepID=A0A1D3TWJ5_9FIRM|nr:hypothetical protein [Anaerobium acetethylicum]SCP98610.1 hypothetical protein SAMN05421730_102325 [Anaerobium acetethylicum]